MILNLIVIALVLATGYIWLSRGFFSALLNLIATVLGGAIAFAIWEPVSVALLGALPRTGFLGAAGTSSWALGLLIPFAIGTAIIRVVMDVVVGKNLRLQNTVDMAGGAVCGLGTGVIASGMIVIGLGFARLPPSLAGYAPVDVNRGSPNAAGGLWLPSDTLVATLYSNLSIGAFSSGQPLEELYPNLALTPATMRLSHGDGKAMNVLSPDDFSIAGSYTVSADNPSPVGQLLGTDRWYSGPASVTNINGESFGAGSLRGYIINFGPGARESTGQVVIASPQVRLLLDNQDGSTSETFAHAVVSVTESSERQYVRFRYDSKDAVASVGGGDVKMAFEFVVPQGATPRSLIIKNIRKPLDPAVQNAGPQTVAFSTIVERDAAIARGSLMGGDDVTADLDITQAAYIDNTSGAGADGLRTGVSLPFRLIMNKADRGGLEINDDNQIVNGTNTFSVESFQNTRGMEASLSVRNFTTLPGIQLVFIDVGVDSEFSLTSAAALNADRTAPPVLFDTASARYQAIGYVYRDEEIVKIRFTPQLPITGVRELERDGVELSRNNPNQEMVLIFAVTENADVEQFALGEKVIALLENPVDVGSSNRRR